MPVVRGGWFIGPVAGVLVVVDLQGREENAQFNVVTGDIPCESVILRG